MTTGKGQEYIHTSLTLCSYARETNTCGMERNDWNVYDWNARVSTAVLNMRCSNIRDRGIWYYQLGNSTARTHRPLWLVLVLTIGFMCWCVPAERAIKAGAVQPGLVLFTYVG